MADASTQYVNFYRGITTANGVIQHPVTLALVLSNTVQWIYGLSFAFSVILIGTMGVMFGFTDERRLLINRFWRAGLRFALGEFVLLVVSC